MSLRNTPRGFTLIELVLSMAMAALLALSLYTAMNIAIRAKRTALGAVEPTRAVSIATDLVRRDFESVLPPTGIFAGPFTGVHQPGVGGDNDGVVFYSMESGTPGEDSPLSEGIRRVELQVRADLTPPALVRRVTRNLLPSAEAIVDEEILCNDVRSFSLRYFDGTTWQENWDSTAQGDVLPVAVSLSIELNDPQAAQPELTQRKMSRVFALSCAKVLDTAATGGTQ